MNNWLKSRCLRNTAFLTETLRLGFFANYYLELLIKL